MNLFILQTGKTNKKSRIEMAQICFLNLNTLVFNIFPPLFHKERSEKEKRNEALRTSITLLGLNCLGL
jgi:hypothetical protein